MLHYYYLGTKNIQKSQNTTSDISQNKPLSETFEYPQLIWRSLDETVLKLTKSKQK